MLFLMMMHAVVVCAERAPQEAAKLLQSAYEKTETFTADFKQETAMRMSTRSRTAEGRVTIKKPMFIRWDYVSPDKQILVGNGRQFLMYFEKTKQMIIRPVDDYMESDVTYAFFTGTGDILRDFDVHDGKVEDGILETDLGDDFFLKLVPKKQHPQLEYMLLWIDRSSHLINRLQLIDLFGNVTDLVFSNIHTGVPVAEEYFSFTPPPGTEVIEQN